MFSIMKKPLTIFEYDFYLSSLKFPNKIGYRLFNTLFLITNLISIILIINADKTIIMEKILRGSLHSHNALFHFSESIIGFIT